MSILRDVSEKRKYHVEVATTKATFHKCDESEFIVFALLL